MEQTQWKQLFAEQLSSGLSVREFCLSTDIKQKTFYTRRSASRAVLVGNYIVSVDEAIRRVTQLNSGMGGYSSHGIRYQRTHGSGQNR